MTPPVLSVDLGGTRMRAALVTPDGEVLELRVEPTPHDAPCPDALLAPPGLQIEVVGAALGDDAGLAGAAAWRAAFGREQESAWGPAAAGGVARTTPTPEALAEEART